VKALRARFGARVTIMGGFFFVPRLVLQRIRRASHGMFLTTSDLPRGLLPLSAAGRRFKRDSEVNDGILGTFRFDPNGDIRPASIPILRVTGATPPGANLPPDFQGATLDRFVQVPANLVKCADPRPSWPVGQFSSYIRR
jgi:hypothetical protein